MKKPKKTIFIDTNIFLHYKFFSEIDWTEIVEASEVLIVIPPIIMREIEKHKFNQKDQVLRKRIEKVSARLAKIFDSKEEVRPRTTMFFAPWEPDDEFSSFRLSRETQDDHLLASICLYRREHPDEDIILITNDLPLRVKANALRIETKQLPENLRIPTETDPNEKKLKNSKDQSAS